jgi:hypothetical protein
MDKAKSPMINIGKVNAKKRKVFRDSKGRTYVKQGDKKVYVKKLFTPERNPTPSRTAEKNKTPERKPTPAKSPMINTEKVDAKKRKVFRDSKGRTYVKQGDKKVYVKKLFTPERKSTPVGNQKSQTTMAKGCSTPRGLGQVSGTCWFNSTLNGFILAEGTAKMILKQIDKLSQAEIVSVSKSFPEDSCPTALSKKYIYHYFMKIHSDQPIVGGSGNNAVDLIGKIFTPKRLSTPTAKGEAGGQAGVAALQILKILFGFGSENSIVHLQAGWKTSYPIGIYEHTKIIYRWGPTSSKFNKSLDSHPMFIKYRGGKQSFKLSHIAYDVVIPEGLHAVVAYVCGNKKFIYDSNEPRNIEVDWSDPKNKQQILDYSGAKRFAGVSYTLYVRE